MNRPRSSSSSLSSLFSSLSVSLSSLSPLKDGGGGVVVGGAGGKVLAFSTIQVMVRVREACLSLKLNQDCVENIFSTYHSFLLSTKFTLPTTTTPPPLPFSVSSSSSSPIQKTKIKGTILQVFFFSAGCILLGIKQVDELRKVRDIINSTYLIFFPESPPLCLNSDIIWAIKDEVFVHEQMILRATQFQGLDKATQPSHSFLLSFLSQITHSHSRDDKEKDEEIRQQNNPLAQTAWCVCNDVSLFPEIRDYKGEEIACACLFFAEKLINQGTILKEGEWKHWFEGFGVEESTLSSLCLLFLSLLERLEEERERERKRKEAMEK